MTSRPIAATAGCKPATAIRAVPPSTWTCLPTRLAARRCRCCKSTSLVRRWPYEMVHHPVVVAAGADPGAGGAVAAVPRQERGAARPVEPAHYPHGGDRP